LGIGVNKSTADPAGKRLRLS
jgi:hypothetical protein